jgi:hypothetical protein
MSCVGKLCLAAGLLTPLAAQADDTRSYDKASFYFSAHQDDWQLFMNPSAFQDVAGARTKTVFVYLTAGDAGSGTGARGRKHPFYLARENGARAAVRFMADADKMPVEPVAETRTFNGHPVYRVSYRNTVSYFLRVPDGNGDGKGYASTGNQSLIRLAQGQIGTMRAVDGSTVYQGWGDLTATLRAMTDYERADLPAVQINVGETDAVANEGDHPDHLMTAKAALEATKDLGCARRLYFLDYASGKLPANLDARQRDMESSVFAANVAAIHAFDHSNNWQYYNDNYVGKNYFRVEEGAGRCDAPAPAVAAVPKPPASAGQQQYAVAKSKP